MIERDELLEVSWLNLVGVIEKMTPGQLNDYIEELDLFTKRFPELEERLKKALETKDYEAFSKRLDSIWDLMRKIHADELSDECRKLSEGIGNKDDEQIETQTVSLLGGISMLSIDIQMIENKHRRAAFNNDGAAPVSKGKERVPKEPVDILAVDDSAFFLRALRQMLQDTDYKAAYVKSGKDAMIFLGSHTARLFILDILMPGMNGYELAEQIRASGQKAPIIFLTGNAKREYVENAIKAGGVDFIVKPAKREDVVAKIKKYIG